MMNFKFYGNWGGPGWAGGKYVAEGEKPDFNVRAIDWADELFKQHDEKYWNAEQDYRNTGDVDKYREDVARADSEFISDARNEIHKRIHTDPVDSAMIAADAAKAAILAKQVFDNWHRKGPHKSPKHALVP